MSEYTLQIVTPTETVFEGPVESVIAPGEAGDLGVLANHAPLDTIIRPGRLTVKNKDKEINFNVGQGFLEVRENKATLLVTSAEKI